MSDDDLNKEYKDKRYKDKRKEDDDDEGENGGGIFDTILEFIGKILGK